MTLNPIRWVRRWAEDLAERVVRQQLEAERDRIVIRASDPLAVAHGQRGNVERQLRDAANHVGANILVGRDVVIWGGRHPSHAGLFLDDEVRLYDHCRLVIDQLDAQSGIRLGRGVALNFGCYIDGSGGVQIGEGSILGPNVVIVSSGHVASPGVSLQVSGKQRQRVEIGRNVWVGANAVIRMGVTVGDDAVIGAASMVTRDVPARSVVFGNPARVVRTNESDGS